MTNAGYKSNSKGELIHDGNCIARKFMRAEMASNWTRFGEFENLFKAFQMISVIDEITSECVAVRVARKLKSTDVIQVSAGTFLQIPQ